MPDEFKAKYKKHAGVEGTIWQGTRSFGLRRSRDIGLAKTQPDGQWFTRIRCIGPNLRHCRCLMRHPGMAVQASS